MREEYEERIVDMRNDHTTRVKQLAKELQAQMDEKEREFQETLNSALGRREFQDTLNSVLGMREFQETLNSALGRQEF